MIFAVQTALQLSVYQLYFNLKKKKRTNILIYSSVKSKVLQTSICSHRAPSFLSMILDLQSNTPTKENEH